MSAPSDASPSFVCIIVIFLFTLAAATDATAQRSSSTSSCSAVNGSNCDAASVNMLLSNLLPAATDVTTSSAAIAITGTADVSKTDEGNLRIQTNLNVSKTTETACATLEHADSMSQTQLINSLTASCRYDRNERPPVLANETLTRDDPVQIYARIYIYVLQSIDTNQFKLNGLLQLRYVDPRLAFGMYTTARRNQPIMGEAQLRNLIWAPHIFLSNEAASSVMGTNSKDLLTVISADGTVILSSRVQVSLYCWMYLQKFPFDEQDCAAVIESWMYNASELVLHWEDQRPLAFDPNLHISEYNLQNAWGNESILNADLNNLRHGSFVGNYSTLCLTVHLSRDVGYYMMDYFLPSMMIVAISWVTFWLQPDQTPARTTLGTSTLLSFITLASSQEKNLPKVGYIKVSEIWFLVCTLFIISSLTEFAFVNTIWRRKKNVQMKRVNSVNILKSTVAPRTKKIPLNKSVSCSSNCLTVDTPTITIISEFDGASNSGSTATFSIGDGNNEDLQLQQEERKRDWSSMTPQEVALWIDRKARFIFPLIFIVFNAFFWTFVYCF